jgi:predicted nucleic acid-binding Zn ribbon protein
MNDKPDSECGICGSKNVKRLISGGSGFLLKGEGWFKDGYASKKS